MALPRDSTCSLLVVACFSRHPEALAWAEAQLQPAYGPIAQRSADYDFHQTRYYEADMGPALRKRLLVFEPLVPPDCLPDVKRHTIGLERALAETGRFPERRPRGGLFSPGREADTLWPTGANRNAAAHSLTHFTPHESP